MKKNSGMKKDGGMKDGRGSGASAPVGAVNGRVRMMAPGRYQINLQALMASVEASVARKSRHGSGFSAYSDGGDFDVLSVMAERDSLAYLTASHFVRVAAAAAWRHCPPAMARTLLDLCLPAIVEADLLLWHQEIWTAAVGADGSGAAFEDVPYRAEDLPPRVQYWGYNRDLVQAPDALSDLGLPPGYVGQAHVLFPLPARDSPRDRWPAYLQGLSAADARAVLRGRASMMPLMILNPDASAGPVDPGAPDAGTPRYRFFEPIEVGLGGGGPYDYLLAGLSFLQQDFVEERAISPGPRAERRRLEAACGTLPDVRTVAFRKAAPGPGTPETEHRPYDCHFLVGSHWRRPHARMLEQRPVFVRPYVKGDTDKPFKPPRQTVNVAKR